MVCVPPPPPHESNLQRSLRKAEIKRIKAAEKERKNAEKRARKAGAFGNAPPPVSLGAKGSKAKQEQGQQGQQQQQQNLAGPRPTMQAPPQMGQMRMSMVQQPITQSAGDAEASFNLKGTCAPFLFFLHVLQCSAPHGSAAHAVPKPVCY